MYAMKCSTHSLFHLGCGGTLLRWLPDCGLDLLTSGTWSTLRDIMNINQMCVSPLILLKVLLLPKPKNTQEIQFTKVQQIFFFSKFGFKACPHVVVYNIFCISKSIFIWGLQDSQTDTNEYVFVWLREKKEREWEVVSPLPIQQSLTILSFSDSDQVWLTKTA